MSIKEKTLSFSQAVDVYRSLDESERKIASALAIKKYLSKRELSAHDVAVAFYAQKRMREGFEVEDSELKCFIDKFEKILRA